MRHFLVYGLVISLTLTACTAANKTSSEAFQPTQTQSTQTQVNPTQTNPAQVSQTASVPTQSDRSTETKAVPFPPTQTQTVRTQSVPTETVPFQPTQAQVVQAQQQLGAQTTRQEVRIVLPADVLFNFDQATIRPDAAAALRQTLTVIRYYKEMPIRIEGHTDSKGSDVYNQTLSEQRSQSVEQWLVAQGEVPISRLTTRGFGESKPRAQNTQADGSDAPAGRQLNRRVEIVIQKQV